MILVVLSDSLLSSKVKKKSRIKIRVNLKDYSKLTNTKTLKKNEKKKQTHTRNGIVSRTLNMRDIQFKEIIQKPSKIFELEDGGESNVNKCLPSEKLEKYQKYSSFEK